MSSDLPPVLQILTETCAQNSCEWELIDKISKNLIRVSKNKQHFYSSNSTVGTYPINSNSASQLASDKAWTYLALRQAGFQIPNGKSFLLRNTQFSVQKNKTEISSAIEYAKQLGFPVFVKPNKSHSGHLASVATSEKHLEKQLNTILKIDFIAIIQEVISFPEYRIFVLDGKAEFMYERKKSADSVTANIAVGGEIRNYTENIPIKIQEFAKAIAHELQLRVCGIDIFLRGPIDNPEQMTIIEVNSSPSLQGIYQLGHKKKVISIWEKILKEYFDE